MILVKVFQVVLCLFSVRLLQSVKCNSCNECRINLQSDLSDLQPLLLNVNRTEILYPKLSDHRVLRLSVNDKIEFYCSDTERYISECLYDTFFEIIESETEYDFTNFSCPILPEHTARRTGKTCGTSKYVGTEIEIGFQTAEQTFIRLMRVCHNEDEIVTYYVHYVQKPRNLEFQRNFPRPRFFQGSFHSHLNMDRMFTRREQRIAVARILQSENLANHYIHQSNDFFFARGHLAAMSDFIYGTEQHATFYFLNVAPQWQMFNGGNWAVVERSLKRFVANRNIDAEIYTGTYGILTLPDEYGVQHEIYLSDRKQIPVPKFFYKIIIEPSTNSGIVFIGVNNVYATMDEIQEDYILCEDVSSGFDWLGENLRGVQWGYIYACRVDQFIRVVTHFDDNDQLHQIFNLLI